MPRQMGRGSNKEHIMDTRKEQKPIEDEKLDKVSGGYVLEHDPTHRENPPGGTRPPQNPLKHGEPM